MKCNAVSLKVTVIQFHVLLGLGLVGGAVFFRWLGGRTL